MVVLSFIGVRLKTAQAAASNTGYPSCEVFQASAPGMSRSREPTPPVCVSRTRGARSCHMPTIKQILLGLVLAVGIVSPEPLLADRAPSPEERSRIETTLRNEGFTRWGKIELDDDDDLWEIDDAYASEGRRYDL